LSTSLDAACLDPGSQLHTSVSDAVRVVTLGVQPAAQLLVDVPEKVPRGNFKVQQRSISQCHRVSPVSAFRRTGGKHIVDT
jgi:hypothetical protein